METNWEDYRNKIIGLGENSFKKSYYPELQLKIDELEASKLNFETIFNSTSDSIIIHDYEGKILNLNNQAQCLFNIHSSEFDAFTIFDILSDKYNKSSLHQVWHKVAQTGALSLEWLVKQNKTDKEIEVHVSISKTVWNKKDVLIASIRDFTERKEYEKKLLEALEKVEESNRLKSAFLQNMSHEIRTPMNAIVGFSGLITEPQLTIESRKKYSAIIINSANQLLSIVTDILTMSALETKQEKIMIQEINLNRLMDELFTIFTEETKSRKLSLYLNKSIENQNCDIRTDSTKLRQVLINLLNNAIKFTHFGYIEFGYAITNGFLQFYVKDTGIGIKKDAHEKIFERFIQANDNNEKFYGGTGLGLAISKSFIELLGGKIWVESEINKGATFYFTIPFLPVNQALLFNQNKNPKYKRSTILIAEDEEFNYLFLEILLEKMNYVLLHTKNGEETVNACKTNLDIDIVLMDIKMPVLDGYNAAKQIKIFRPELPIIAQSAYIQDNEELESKELAFDDFIPKPIKKEVLIEKLLKFIA